jgi:hypothetical protein
METFNKGIEVSDIQSIPEITADTNIFMFKPDVYLKSEISSVAKQNILIGLGDCLCGRVFPEFYKSQHGANVATWALEKGYVNPSLTESERLQLVISIESLRSRYSVEDEKSNIEEFIYSILGATGFKLISEVDCKLTETQIRILYPYLNKPKNKLVEKEYRQRIEKIQDRDIRFLFLEKQNGNNFLKLIQFFLRKNLRDWSREIYNGSESLVHIPVEGEETITTYKLITEYFEANQSKQ